MFLLWFDDTKKKPTEQKIEEGVQRYLERFGTRPNVCLVHPGDAVPTKSVLIRPVPFVRPNNYWLGREEPAASKAA